MKKNLNWALAAGRDCASAIWRRMLKKLGPRRENRETNTKDGRSAVRKASASCNMPTTATVVDCGRRHRNRNEV
jgi:hypothetical protein